MQTPPLPPQDMPLRSPRSLLQRNLDTEPYLDPELDLVIDAPEAAVLLNLFLPLLQCYLDLDPDLFLA